MKIFRVFPLFLFLLMSSAMLVISGCSDTAAMIRTVTYPPDFNYVSEQDLQSRMNQLAFQVRLLDQVLEDKKNGESNQPRQVPDILGNIERIMSKLKPGDSGSNHPYLEGFMRNFMNEVAEAKAAALLDPPNYYPAGRVAGGCVNCHSITR